MTARLVSGSETKIPRVNFKTYDPVKVHLFCFIYSCFELAPYSTSDGVKARVEVHFSDLNPSNNANTIIESATQTKNPIFGERQEGAFLIETVDILGGVDLAPNFRI